MDKPRPRKSFLTVFFQKLIEARWFFAFSASGCATIVGISLTFGINSCRENRRVKHEMHKSMLQATDNIGERFENIDKWMSKIQAQNRLYEIADSLLSENAQLPDTLCEEIRYTLPYVRLTAFDHEFEKIFRGSYQLWQLRNNNDSLTYYLGECYDGLNTVESTCDELTTGMLDEIGLINAETSFWRKEPPDWTRILLTNPRFQYYMSLRRGKTGIALDVLEQTREIYTKKVLPLSEKLRDE